MQVIKEYYSQFIEGNSAKQYLLVLVAEDDGTFGVAGLFGRIGAANLQSTWKTRGLASQEAAEVTFAAGQAERDKKGYQAADKPADLDAVSRLGAK